MSCTKNIVKCRREEKTDECVSLILSCCVWTWESISLSPLMCPSGGIALASLHCFLWLRRGEWHIWLVNVEDQMGTFGPAASIYSWKLACLRDTCVFHHHIIHSEGRLCPWGRSTHVHMCPQLSGVPASISGAKVLAVMWLSCILHFSFHR